MNKKQFAFTFVTVFFGVLCAAQPSYALDLKKLFDPMLKRAVCAAMGVNIGDCMPEQQYSPPFNYSNPSYPEYPQQLLNNQNQPYEYPQYMSPNQNQPYGYPQQPLNSLNQPYGYPQYTLPNSNEL